jgi:hypothetical protein
LDFPPNSFCAIIIGPASEVSLICSIERSSFQRNFSALAPKAR